VQTASSGEGEVDLPPGRAASPLPAILGALAGAAGQLRLGEPVTSLEHALQCADAAEREGCAPALVVAALLHDVGWLPLPAPAGAGGTESAEVGEGEHAARGAALLAGWLPPGVVEPVRLHVEAKRWLCSVEPAYHAGLSEASRLSLVAQGGQMDAEERRAFEAEPFFQDALLLRRLDDGAKTPGRKTPGLARYVPLVERLSAG